MSDVMMDAGGDARGESYEPSFADMEAAAGYQEQAEQEAEVQRNGPRTSPESLGSALVCFILSQPSIASIALKRGLRC